jgi:hypothetical protein
LPGHEPLADRHEYRHIGIKDLMQTSFVRDAAIKAQWAAGGGMALVRDGRPRVNIGRILALVAVVGAHLAAPAFAQSPFRGTNPTSSLTLTAGTMPYAAGQLIANASTPLSITNPSFLLPPGGAAIAGLRLSTNDETLTAWGGQTIQVDLWSAPPTWANGDRGAWSPATGTAAHLASFTCNMSPEYGDGAYAECAPNVGSFGPSKLPGSTQIYWSLQAITGSGATGAARTFMLTAVLLN